MSIFSTEDRVVYVLENLVISGRDITRESTWEDIGFDSLDKIDFLMDMEDEFNVYIPDEIMEILETVGEVIDYIDRISPK
jgi:acyl carrier protein